MRGGGEAPHVKSLARVYGTGTVSKGFAHGARADAGNKQYGAVPDVAQLSHESLQSIREPVVAG